MLPLRTKKELCMKIPLRFVVFIIPMSIVLWGLMVIATQAGIIMN